MAARRVAGLVLVALSAWAAGCRDQLFEPVRDGLVASVALEGDVRVVTRADLLFVVDDSPSMASEQAKLAAGFPQLVAALGALDPPVDWRAGVITSSVSERFGTCDAADPGAPAACAAAFGGSGYACEAGACVRRWSGAGALVAAGANPAVIEGAALSPAEAARLFAENVRVGTGGARQEQPLRVVRQALESGRLAALLRPGARLVVVIASDEDDCSDTREELRALESNAGALVDRCAEASVRDTGRLDDVDEWVKWMRTGREVSMGAVAGLAPGTQEPGACVDEACATRCADAAGLQACAAACAGSLRASRCEEECVAQCVSFCGAEVPGRRLARAVRGLGGTLASVCESDFGPALARLARVLGIPDALDLPSAPADDRAVFFAVTRGPATLACAAGRDYYIDRTSMPPRLVIAPAGACALRPDDHWAVRYLATP